MQVNTEVILRTVVLGLTWVNMALTGAGKNPLPFSEEEIYGGVSSLLAFGATAWAWWKNNSFTKEGVEADAYLSHLKKGRTRNG